MEWPQQRGGPILSAEDSKSIFGNIPEILAVHQNIVVGRAGRGGRREGGGGGREEEEGEEEEEEGEEEEGEEDGEGGRDTSCPPEHCGRESGEGGGGAGGGEGEEEDGRGGGWGRRERY